MKVGKRTSIGSWMALAAVTFVLLCGIAMAQDVQGDLGKRVKTRVQPTYPELARRMSVRGSVKIMVTVGANGKLKNTKVMGGHPVLVAASEDAIRRWKFEPGADEATGVVEFSFESDTQ